MPTDDAAFEYLTGGDDELSVRRIRTNGPQAGTIGPRPDHVVFWLADGHAIVTADDGERVDVRPGQPVVLSAPVAYAFETDATSMTLMHIAPALLGDADESYRFVQPDPTDNRTEPLRTLLRDAVDRVLDPELPDTERRALKQRIARVVLSTYTRARSDVEHRMRHAIAFVHEHAGDPITVADIADACGLSERGLQDLFRRRLAVTPMRYLREARLDRVHLEFTTRGRRILTVRDVAHRWQFTHLGRFASEYRARFGESPRETLARSAGRR
ncbi:helix-turn-helix transcriptional regulator [Curtobacterium luteum]|uniref:helix-turn-helix transcriptional regulator n=1 Tax=Curtobacterium luteum TaxID=33881 RepID=UPI000736D0DC|nr:AraC family transcriptional regulator [Curtobacterium luteum]